MSGEQRSVAIDGRTLRYSDYGESGSTRVLTLVHGFPLGERMWAPQYRAFAGWRAIVPSLAGFDGSDGWPGVSIDGYASQVLALLDRLGVARSVWCGLSMGGYVTLRALAQSAGRISGVVLADTRSPADTEGARAGRERMLDLAGTGGPVAVATELLPKILGPTTMASRPGVISALRAMIEDQPAETIAAATRALMTRPDSTPVLETIGVPSLVIVGEEDTLTPPSDSEQLHARIPGSTLVTLARAGHMSNMENPDAFNAAVAALLERC